MKPCLLLLALAPALPAFAADEPHTDTAKTKAIAEAATEKTIVFDAAKIEKRGVAATFENGALKILSGHKEDWPGLTIKAPGGNWDWSASEYFAVDVKNSGPNKASLALRVDNKGANGIENCNTARIEIAPGQSTTLRVDFNRAAPEVFKGKLFGMRGLPRGTGGGSGPTIDPAQVNQFLLFVPKPTEDHTLEVSNFRVGGSFVAPTLTANFFPFIDTFGQYKHKDWPGKVHSLAELKARIATEEKEWQAKPGPDNFDKWGGWANGPKLEATGFFRTAKHGGKWWLVDPDGRLFWSHGATGVRPGNSTPILDRDSWFEAFPGNDPQFAEFFENQGRVVRGYYKGKEPFKNFNFTNANLKRKYGDDWRQKYAEAAHKRLRSWGMNTIANWSDSAVYSLRRTPYVVALGSDGPFIEGSEGYWGQFRDPFAPEFKEKTRARFAQEKNKSAGDPWCLGYFVDNELGWGNDTSLAIAALKSPATQAAKITFISDLKEKYQTIEKLNAAWGTTHASWDALAQFRGAPDEKNAAAKADLKAFYTRLAEQYFSTLRGLIKEVAPQQLYLGCRFAWVNDSAALAATKFCDVVSYNRYNRSVKDLKPAGAADVPLIIGEFHFGALDRGMFHTGLVPTKDQNERAAAYKNYVQSALENPFLVGTHWFQYSDQPATGRGLDEENYQIGMIDGADTPYAETIGAVRDIGYQMYAIRSR